MTDIVVSSPGKIHLLGEHTVVYGSPALLASVDKRCVVKLTSRNDDKIEIISKNFDVSSTRLVDDVLKTTKNAREVWKRFEKNEDFSLISSLTKHPLDYLFLAVGESLFSYSLSERAKRMNREVRGARPDSRLTSFARTIKRGFTLTIESQIPIGFGCGSSSAVAVSIAGAIQLLFEKSLDTEKVFKTALRIEEFKHGTPSGGDPMAVLHGGFVWFERKNGKNICKPLDITLSSELSKKFMLLDTGKPLESTGEMIGVVRQFMDTNSRDAQKVFEDQERLMSELVNAIKEQDSTSIIRIIRVGEGNLEKLGVVSPFVKKLIREVEQTGGAAKISGGGGREKGTGMLLVFAPDKNAVKSIGTRYGLSYFDTILGEEGLRNEK